MSRAQPQPARRNNRSIILYATLGVVAIGIIIAVALAARVPKGATSADTAPPPSALLHVGERAPNFSAATTAGPFTLDHSLAQPAFVEVFATWCPHCQRETSTINALYSKYKDRVHFVAVSGSELAMDYASPASQNDVVAFGQQFKVKYPLAFDPDLTVAKEGYYSTGFPSLTIVGKDGKIRYINSGEITQADLAKALDAALKG